MRKAAFYGLAGNPPHRGHWGCVRDLAQRGYFVVISPSAGHAFGKTMAPYEQRLEWLRLGANDFCPDLAGQFLIWEGEPELREALGGQTVYSIDALKAFQAARPDLRLSLAVGPDNAAAAVFSKFKDHETITRDFGVVVTPEQDAVRSTQIRVTLGLLEAGGQDMEALARLRKELEATVGSSVASELERIGFRIQGGYLPLDASSPKPK